MPLGDRIKQLRLNSNLSVRQLASKVGVTASFIYQLEQNKVSPSFSTLKSMSTALNTKLGLLIEDELPEEWIVIKKNQRKRLVTESDTVKFEMLAFLGTRVKKMQPLVFELEIGAAKEYLPSFAGDHEDLIYIIQGQVEVTVKNSAYILNCDDAAYFMFDSPLSLQNLGEEKAMGIWVVSPPGI